MLKPLMVALALVGLGMSSNAWSQEKEAPAERTIKILDTLTVKIPASWQEKEVRSRIIEREYAIVKGEGEDAPTARVTLMPAGGGVEPNIDRWKGQFTGGGETVTEKMDVAGQAVHYVRLDGTFKESMGGGPFAPGRTVLREKYVMLGAIVEMKDGRLYFIKATGPEALMDEHTEEFKKMLKSIE